MDFGLGEEDREDTEILRVRDTENFIISSTKRTSLTPLS